MDLKPLVEPTITIIGNGAVTPTKVAEFSYEFSSGEKFVESCWKFVATPAAGELLVSMRVRCVIRGASEMHGTEYDLTNDKTKEVSSGYTSFWFEEIEGETHDTTQEYWFISGTGGVSPKFDLRTFYKPYTELFEVSAEFTGTRQKGIIYSTSNRQIVYSNEFKAPAYYP